MIIIENEDNCPIYTCFCQDIKGTNRKMIKRKSRTTDFKQNIKKKVKRGSVFISCS